MTPLILHTGVANLEDHEAPYEEYYRVPDSTARLVEGQTTWLEGQRGSGGYDHKIQPPGDYNRTRWRRLHPGEGWT